MQNPRWLHFILLRICIFPSLVRCKKEKTREEFYDTTVGCWGRAPEHWSWARSPKQGKRVHGRTSPSRRAPRGHLSWLPQIEAKISGVRSHPPISHCIAFWEVLISDLGLSSQRCPLIHHLYVMVERAAMPATPWSPPNMFQRSL